MQRQSQHANKITETPSMHAYHAFKPGRILEQIKGQPNCFPTKFQSPHLWDKFDGGNSGLFKWSSANLIKPEGHRFKPRNNPPSM